MLVSYWHEAHWRTIRKHLPGRSSAAIYLRAVRVLKLPTGLPQGTCALKPLARSQRYSVAHMRRILAWGKVRTRQLNCGFGTRRRRLCVDQHLALEVFERWEREAETVATAAARLHINETRLLDLMICAGHRPSRRADRYAPRWKNMPADYDLAVAEDRRARYPGESIRAAARRLGVPHPRLVRALAAFAPTAPAAVRPWRRLLEQGFADNALAYYVSLKRGQKGTRPVRPATQVTDQTIHHAGPAGQSDSAHVVALPVVDGVERPRKKGRPKGSRNRPKCLRTKPLPKLTVDPLPVSATESLPTLEQIARLYGRKPV